MKQNWKIFELIISGIQIFLGIIMLIVVYITITSYYYKLWINPLIDHAAIAEMAFRGNVTLVILALIAIFSGILLIKNKINGYILSQITWVMLTLLLLINSIRLFQKKALDIDFLSGITIGIIATTFLIILFLLNNSAFRKKYFITRCNWIFVSIIITILTASKFL